MSAEKLFKFIMCSIFGHNFKACDNDSLNNKTKNNKVIRCTLCRKVLISYSENLKEKLLLRNDKIRDSLLNFDSMIVSMPSNSMAVKIIDTQEKILKILNKR